MKLFRITSHLSPSTPQSSETLILNAAQWKLSPTFHSLERGTLQHVLSQNSYVKQKFGFLVGSPEECHAVAQVAKFLYLPGEVCRQADVLEAAKETQLPVFLERGAFLSPTDILLALPKLSGCSVTLIDVGSHFGFGDRVLDPRAFAIYSNAKSEMGVNISDLLGTDSVSYSYEPNWVHDPQLIDKLLATSFALGAQCVVYRDYGRGALTEDAIRASCERLGK